MLCSEGAKPLEKFRAELVCVGGPGSEQRSAKCRESKLPSGRNLGAHRSGRRMIALTMSTLEPAEIVELDKAGTHFRS